MSLQASLRCGYLYAAHHQRNYIFIFKGTIKLVCLKSGSGLGKKLTIQEKTEELIPLEG